MLEEPFELIILEMSKHFFDHVMSILMVAKNIKLLNTFAWHQISHFRNFSARLHQLFHDDSAKFVTTDRREILHYFLSQEIRATPLNHFLNEMGSILIVAQFNNVFVDKLNDEVQILVIQAFKNSLKTKSTSFVLKQFNKVFLKGV